MNARTSSRNAASSGLSRSSIVANPTRRGTGTEWLARLAERTHRGHTAERVSTAGSKGEHILRSTTRAAASLAVVLTVAFAAAGSAFASDVTGHGARDGLASADVTAPRAAQKFLDKRGAQLSPAPPAATAALKDSLGAEGVVKLDALTGTARVVG